MGWQLLTDAEREELNRLTIIDLMGDLEDE